MLVPDENSLIRQMVHTASDIIDTQGFSNVTVAGCSRGLSGFDGVEISAFPSLDPDGESLAAKVDSMVDTLVASFRDWALRKEPSSIEDGVAFTRVVIG